MLLWWISPESQVSSQVYVILKHFIYMFIIIQMTGQWESVWNQLRLPTGTGEKVELFFLQRDNKVNE